MRFFNAQNHSSGYRNPVFLNITDKDCKTFEFREEIVDDTNGYTHYEIVSNDRFLRSHKDFCFINYAYAGGVNKCNYDRRKTFKDGNIYLTFTLAKTLHPSLPEDSSKWRNTLLWDFGHAVFKNSSPVITIELVFSKTGELKSSTFTSLYDLNPEGDFIQFSSVSDDQGNTDYYTPDQVTSSGDKTPMSLDMAFSYQDPDTDLYRRVVKGRRENTDTVGGHTDIEPVCWFLKNDEEYMSLVMVVFTTSVAWDMNQTPSQGFSYCKWFSDDGTVSEYENVTFPGYKGLDI